MEWRPEKGWRGSCSGRDLASTMSVIRHVHSRHGALRRCWVACCCPGAALCTRHMLAALFSGLLGRSTGLMRAAKPAHHTTGMWEDLPGGGAGVRRRQRQKERWRGTIVEIKVMEMRCRRRMVSANSGVGQAWSGRDFLSRNAHLPKPPQRPARHVKFLISKTSSLLLISPLCHNRHPTTTQRHTTTTSPKLGPTEMHRSDRPGLTTPSLK